MDQNLINRRIALLRCGHSQATLAKAIGVTPAAITFVMTGKTKSPAMHKKIADKLGVTLAEFWPEYYTHF
jgi:lambda repressor-like predicted transcriptional regulator